MKTVKVTVKREQINKSLWAGAKVSTQVHRGSGSIYYTEDFPEEITLELPAEQVELGPVSLKPNPNPLTCVHEFDEIELGGMGRIKRCRICGTAWEVKQEKKRRQFRVTEIHCRGRFGEYLKAGDLLLLEEVE